MMMLIMYACTGKSLQPFRIRTAYVAIQVIQVEENWAEQDMEEKAQCVQVLGHFHVQHSKCWCGWLETWTHSSPMYVSVVLTSDARI